MAEVAYAPPVQDLREHRPVRVAWAGPQRRYAWLDDAYWIDDVYGEAPPDYAFDYDDVGPVAWLDGAFVVCIGEPIEGGVRFFYYEPGEAWPYFVAAPSFAYGFDDGVLTVVYDANGDPLPFSAARAQLPLAQRYFARGASLQLAARQGDRRQVSLAAWQADARAFEARRAAWDRTLGRNQDWQLYHAEHRPTEQGRWREQRAWRVAEADVARSTAQQLPPSKGLPAPRGAEQQAALQRAWRDQRALVDQQMAASAAAEDQLARARAFAASHGANARAAAPATRSPAQSERRQHAYALGGERSPHRRVSARRFETGRAYALARPEPYRIERAERAEPRDTSYRVAALARSAGERGVDPAARAPSFADGAGGGRTEVQGGGAPRGSGAAARPAGAAPHDGGRGRDQHRG